MQGARLLSNEAYLRTSKQRNKRSNAAVGEFLRRHQLSQTEKNLRLVGYRVDGTDYWIATNRNDLTAEEIAEVYKLRWNIETFFGWWKRHLKVYHLNARSKYGLMVQLLGGLITYLRLAIYCRQQHNEPVSISRVRELRHQIANEAAEDQRQRTRTQDKNNKVKRLKRKQSKRRDAKT